MYKIKWDENSHEFFPYEVKVIGTSNKVFAGSTLKRIYRRLAKGARKITGLGDEISYYIVGVNPKNPDDYYNSKSDKVIRTSIKAENKYDAIEQFKDSHSNARKIKAFKDMKSADKYFDKLNSEIKNKG